MRDGTIASAPLLLALVAALAGEATPPSGAAPFTPNLDVLAASPFVVHFLDVGTGDSAIIDIGEQEAIIDGGDSVRVLTDYVKTRGIVDGPIELVVVTHGDSDHWKGLNRLLGFDGKNANPPRVIEFWEPGHDRDCRKLQSYENFIEDVSALPGVIFRRPLENTHAPAVATGQPEIVVVPGLTDVSFTVLHTDSTPPASNGDCSYRINNASIVLMAEIFGHRFLFTGDANGKERAEASPGTPGHIEKLLLDLEAAVPGTLRADVIKVPHHGSETASTQAFIDAVDPGLVIISASTRHHLPRETVVSRYDNGQRVILRTDVFRPNDTDHLLCFQNGFGELDCNFEEVLAET